MSPDTSEVSFRSGGQFWSRRQGRKHGGDGTVAMLGQYVLPVCWCHWGGVSVMWCRRQWHGLGTVFGPLRDRVRLYHECTWLASTRVVVVRVRRAITQGRCSRGSWTGVWSARRRRRLSRGGSDVWCVREPSTVTLRGRGRTSVGGGERYRYPTQNVCHYLGIA